MPLYRDEPRLSKGEFGRATASAWPPDSSGSSHYVPPYCVNFQRGDGGGFGGGGDDGGRGGAFESVCHSVVYNQNGLCRKEFSYPLPSRERRLAPQRERVRGISELTALGTTPSPRSAALSRPLPQGERGSHWRLGRIHRPTFKRQLKAAKPSETTASTIKDANIARPSHRLNRNALRPTSVKTP